MILNPEVLPFERPFVLAHEWAHLAGHAPESEASFVAFLACLQGTREAQYSGWLDLFLHVLRNAAGASAAGVARGARRRARAPTCAPSTPACGACSRPFTSVSWSVYDQYLRANRVESGVANYDEVVTLVLGSRLLAARDRPLTWCPAALA